MTTVERKQLEDCMGGLRGGSARLPSTVATLARYLERGINAATTPAHRDRLEVLHKQVEDARQLLLSTHDELAELYQRVPSDATTGE